MSHSGVQDIAYRQCSAHAPDQSCPLRVVCSVPVAHGRRLGSDGLDLGRASARTGCVSGICTQSATRALGLLECARTRRLELTGVVQGLDGASSGRLAWPSSRTPPRRSGEYARVLRSQASCTPSCRSRAAQPATQWEGNRAVSVCCVARAAETSGPTTNRCTAGGMGASRTGPRIRAHPACRVE